MIAAVVLKVLDREGPIEEDLIFIRVRTAWTLSKSGQVIQQRIRAVLKALVKKELIVRVGSAYNLPDREIDAARTPTPQCLRKVAQVPAIERQFALEHVVQIVQGSRVMSCCGRLRVSSAGRERGLISKRR